MFFFISCASYYELNAEFNRNFEKGRLQAADALLAENKKAKKGKNRLLYYMNRGVANSILGNYTESNRYFEQAYILGEDLRARVVEEAASYFTNPTITTYRGEDHEILFIHYYKALNFMKMNKPDEALVEVRRMDIKMKALQDKYKSDLKYKDDAFIHLLMGLVYDALYDFNNAFIAYRNAYKTYKDFYEPEFKLSIPLQLKKDLLRTARFTGLYDEEDRFEKEFGMKYNPHDYERTQLLFFWNNGLGPVKGEWGINFVAVKGDGGAIIFQNEEYGYSFPFIWSSNEDDNIKFEDIRATRVVFPKYIERPKMFNSAVLSTDNDDYKLMLAEDVNAVAFKVLEQRFLAEMGKSLLRLAIKKGSEAALREENENLAAVLSIVNAATEKADTRNWQTLPHSIYYARLPFKNVTEPKEVTLFFKTKSPYGERYDQVHEIQVELKPNQTSIHTFSSLEIGPG